MNPFEMNTDGEVSATFVVRVTAKPGEPWRGNVAWVTERCMQNFDNMQELFELMGSALQNPEMPKEETK